MTKYKNPRIEAEMNDAQEEEHLENELKEQAASIEEEMWKQRYADSRRGVQKLQEEHKRELEELRQEVRRLASKSVEPPASDEDIETWSQKYPEFSRIFRTSIVKEVEKATAETKKELTRIKEKEQEVSVREARQNLKELHPDLDVLFKSGSDFEAWLRKQPQSMQDKIFKSLDVGEADLVISKFKQQAGKSTKAKEAEDDDTDAVNAAKVVRKTVANATFDNDAEYDFSESQIKRESGKDRNWFAKNEAKIMDANRKGRILMDLTGGAR